MNIFNSLLVQLVKYDVHTTRKINSIHAIFLSHIIIIHHLNVIITDYLEKTRFAVQRQSAICYISVKTTNFQQIFSKCAIFGVWFTSKIFFNKLKLCLV